MAERKAGRSSSKKQRLFNVYRVLRCAMMHEDIKELLGRNPRFCERTMDDTDFHIQEAICEMAEAMIALDPPDLSQAEPLRG